jgi:hypothetical protein
MSDETAPLVCNMEALRPAERDRHATLSRELHERIASTTAIDQGYTLGLEVDSAAFIRLAEWVTLEQQCCPFLDFSLELGRDGALLRLTGPEGTPAFLREELGITGG